MPAPLSAYRAEITRLYGPSVASNVRLSVRGGIVTIKVPWSAETYRYPVQEFAGMLEALKARRASKWAGESSWLGGVRRKNRQRGL